MLYGEKQATSVCPNQNTIGVSVQTQTSPKELGENDKERTIESLNARKDKLSSDVVVLSNKVRHLNLDMSDMLHLILIVTPAISQIIQQDHTTDPIDSDDSVFNGTNEY